MTKNVGYVMDTINREISISYEVEEDLIECFIDKSLEIAALRRKKLALVEVTYPEVFQYYKVKVIRPYNKDLTLISIPVEKVEKLKDFYKVLNMKCIVSH